MTERAFLDVEASATGRRWVGPNVEEQRLAEAMAQVTRLPQALCVTLVRRGVAAPDVSGFLAPSLRDLLPDPLTLRDMDRATRRFLTAVAARQRICVFADY
ncbi:MAG: single-stranded-DNA-specific exonuclease RecJ, partial [Pseudorhodobacter sp.]|nr:single-stranded-DNA-specific exonuclease RecJ [Pseudorhodobacter sp.]